MTLTTFSSADLVRDVLARDPRADLHTIRQSHPRLGAMTLDHLGLLLERLMGAQDRVWGR